MVSSLERLLNFLKFFVLKASQLLETVVIRVSHDAEGFNLDKEIDVTPSEIKNKIFKVAPSIDFTKCLF